MEKSGNFFLPSCWQPCLKQFCTLNVNIYDFGMPRGVLSQGTSLHYPPTCDLPHLMAEGIWTSHFTNDLRAFNWIIVQICLLLFWIWLSIHVRISHMSWQLSSQCAKLWHDQIVFVTSEGLLFIWAYELFVKGVPGKLMIMLLSIGNKYLRSPMIMKL